MNQRHALITGFPGFIARRLAQEAPDRRRRAPQVTALVEDQDSLRPPAKALENLVEQSTGDLDLRALGSSCLVGDVTAMDAGLSGPEFRALTERLTEIYHLAALRAVDADQPKAEAVNVHGTQNVLGLAKAARHLRALHPFF